MVIFFDVILFYHKNMEIWLYLALIKKAKGAFMMNWIIDFLR